MRDSTYNGYTEEQSQGRRPLFVLLTAAAAVSLFIAHTAWAPDLGGKRPWLFGCLGFSSLGVTLLLQRRITVIASEKALRSEMLFAGRFRLWSRVFPIIAFEAVVVDRSMGDDRNYTYWIRLRRQNGRNLLVRITDSEYAAETCARRLCPDTGLPLILGFSTDGFNMPERYWDGRRADT